MEQPEKPAFLQPTVSHDYPGISENPTFDEELAAWNAPVEGPNAPKPGIRERWRAVARLYALGQPMSVIARRLNYTQSSLTRIIKEPFVQEEVAKYRAAYETDINTKVKDAAIDGIDRIHQMILDPDEKSTVVLDASKWTVEKATGKPRQEVAVEGGSINVFIEVAKGIRQRGEVVDVTPQTPVITESGTASDTPQTDWDSWLDQHS